MSKGLYMASCMVFKKIHNNTTLSHHLFSSPAKKISSVKDQSQGKVCRGVSMIGNTLTGES